MTYLKKCAIATALATSISAQLPIQTFTLSTGLKCKLIEDHEKPLIRMELVNQWDNDGLTVGKTGLGGLLAAVISTKNIDKDINHKPSSYLNDYLTFKAEIGSYRWNITTNSDSQEAAIALLADNVMRPNINSALLESWRQTLLKQYDFNSPRNLALNDFLHRIEDPEALLPLDKAVLAHFNYQDVLAFKQLAVRPELSTLAIYGDTNLTQTKQLITMYFGAWDPPTKRVSPQLATNKNHDTNRIVAISETDFEIELLAGMPHPNCNITQATNAILPIVLDNITKSFLNNFQINFSLSSRAKSLLIKTKKSKSNDNHQLIIDFLATLHKLQKIQVSQRILRNSITQWSTENSALVLHPAKLLTKVADNSLDPCLAQAIELVTVDDLNQAIKAWLSQERIQLLLLGTEMPKNNELELIGLPEWATSSTTTK